MNAAVPLTVAARELEVDVSTVRRWLAAGCPSARAGRRGRGGGALVVLEDVRRWRGAGGAVEAPVGAWLPKLAEGLREFHRRGEHQKLLLNDSQAAAYLVELYKVIAWRHGGGSTAMPDEIRLLEKLVQ